MAAYMAEERSSMEDITEAMEELINTEEEERLEKERFTSSAEVTEVFLEPQCVKCLHNGGVFNCGKYGEKPEEYISNFKTCPKREV